MNGIINFETSLGTILMVRSVNVIPKKGAEIKLLYVDGFDVEKHKIIMEGEDYKAWGNDDNYIGHYCISQLMNGKATIVGTDYVAPPRPAPATTEPLGAAPVATAATAATAGQVYHDDTRSVHNEADIAKITTLEEQMVEQQRMVAQLKQILISKGMI